MDIYDELGVRKIINGYATLTSLGGSLMPPEVTDAMAAAARSFVNIDELQEKVGQRIAQWTHNEAAYVSCGAAAGLVLSTAACLTGLDPEKRAHLPYTDGMQNEIIVHRRGRTGFEFAIRQAGGCLVEIGDGESASASELEAAISERTAAIFVFYRHTLMDGQVPLEQQLEIARKYELPLVIDAAAQLPPVENLWRFTQMGASLVIFSGGKGLCGPQSSGLILGKRELVEACAFNASPRSFIGRPMKVGKEEIVGLMAALRRYLDLDHEKLLESYAKMVDWMVAELARVPHVNARRSYPNEAGQTMPRAEILLDEDLLGISRDEALRRLYQGEPAISLAPAGENGLFINPQTLQPGEEKIIVEQVKKVLHHG